MTGLRGALTIRVNDGQSDRVVTHYCRGLKFTKVAPGGHQNLSFAMTLPRGAFNDLGPEDRCYVYDARTTRTIIEGYLENPTPVDGPDGQQFDISAQGGMALANDEARALIYIDRDLGQFEKATDAAAAGEYEVADYTPTPTQKRLRVRFDGGAVVGAGAYSAAGNYEFERAGMNLGGINIGTLVNGKTSVDWANDIVNESSTIATGTISTVGGALSYYVGTDFTAGARRFAVRLRRVGGTTTVVDDLTWADYANLVLIGQRMDRNGALLAGAAGLVSNTQVLASQVVEDLLGRLLTLCDAGTAQIDATTFGITQLAYQDGVKVADVLNDLAVFEPDFLWEILGSLDGGKHRFNYRAWPTTPRYEVSVKDGWRQTGSDADLCNRILVSWTDPAGNPQVTTVTAASLGLTGIGLPVDALGTRVKDADPVSLPDGTGSSANATRIGGQILTEKVKPPKAGTVLVRRPIVDLLTGSTVTPWEIEPGYLCRVRETGDDLRITQVDYDDDTTSMLLTLGAPVLSMDQRLARLDRAVSTTLA